MNAPETHIAAPLFGIIPRTHIRLGIWNPRKRITEAELQELAESIRLHGLMQPILVRPIAGEDDMYELVFGERRFRAAEIAALDGIPCQVRVMTDKEVRIAQNIENLQRQDVHPIEEAEGYELLMREDGYTADQLAEETGKSRSYIYGRLKLCALAPSAREAFYDGKLSASAALLVARIPVESLQEYATQEILNDGDPLSYRAAVEHIQERYMLNLDRARFSITDAKLVKEKGSCEECPKRTGNQPMIYGDVSADICTDPNCFASKSRAHDDKVLTVAQKKGVPVYEGEEAKQFIKETELASTEDRLYQFERRVDMSISSKMVEELLEPEQLPKPSAYVRIDGKVKPMYEQTALQVALEKAGICESEEDRERRQQEAQSRKDPAQVAAEEAKRKEDEARKTHRESVAELETNVRLEAYKQIRAKSKDGLDAAVIRVVLKALLGKLSDYYSEHQLPDELLSDVYTFDSSSDEAIIEYIDQADPSTVMLLMMDAIMAEGIEVMPHNLTADLTLDEDIDDFKAFDALVTAAGIDMGALRAELQSAPTSDETKSDGEASVSDSEDQTSDEPSKPAKGGKKKTKVVSEAAWPFPIPKGE